ncbi:MAG: hypothetical protein LAO55_19460 [Acidobacteriia bacterium]|nr:hypothetical protein [Terriglobia bacterium]
MGMAVDTAFAHWWSGDLKSFSREDLSEYWLGHIASIVSVYLIFLFVVVYLLLQESAVKVMEIGCLDDILPAATSYFAIATINLPEWFEPATQLYFSNILQYQVKSGAKHQRVLLFFKDRALTATKETYLDGHYAQCFNAIHKRLEIPLAYLNRQTIFPALAALDSHQQALLCWSRPWTSLLLKLKCWKWLPVGFVLKKRTFAAIEMADGSRAIIQFTKKRDELKLTRLIDKAVVDAHFALVTKIRNVVFGADGKLRHEFDFHEYLTLTP